MAKLLAPSHFELGKPADFRNELNLLTLQKAINIANKVAVDVDSLSGAAYKVLRCHFRARYALSDWEKLVTPLNNIIRENSKNALISYLLVQPQLRVAQNIRDADGLFEFFLIDVQMSSCLQTSRIKHAISTVQLYVQRCLLELEGDVNVDSDRWASLQAQTLYVARRNVFLYPENWLDPSLRDDKTFIYEGLESAPTQKDIKTQTTTDAMTNYLFSLDQVSNLQAEGLYFEGGIVHIFSRTRSPPYVHYYRRFNTQHLWSPWEEIQVDIPNYDVVSNGETIAGGTYLCPFICYGRLIIAFPMFTKKTQPNPQNTALTLTQLGGDPVSTSAPIEFWETKLCWSEYRNGKWTQKQVTANAIYDNYTNDPFVLRI
jgi:Neuraminidase-like domain